jgi:hypothetical protein|tara:strand:- start:167 stop:1363 length:1197 start_codon:yes stop_codon:yes gene_type:complete
MTRIIGLVGKPNCGKSTFFNASTMAGAEIANYPFTTIKANRGVGFVRVKCACKELGVECKPNHGSCHNGTRLVPIDLLDVAGLVKGAHEGKGLGNQFLDDLRQADALLHIIDSAGATDAEGKPCNPGEHNPVEDVAFLEEEIDLWFLSLLKKDWQKLTREIQQMKKDVAKGLAERFSGLGVTESMIIKAAKDSELNINEPANWDEAGLKQFATKMREISKPILLCANKCDIQEAEKNLKPLEETGNMTIPTSADSELALRRAAEKNLIKYYPGETDFTFEEGLSDEQKKGLTFIKGNVLKKFNGTGVQQALDKAAFEMLDLIAVFPVEDENKYTDKNGNPLPDVHLVPKGTTAKQLAYKIHTDIGDKFICGVNAKTKMKLGADHELKDGDVIKISCSK